MYCYLDIKWNFWQQRVISKGSLRAAHTKHAVTFSHLTGHFKAHALFANRFKPIDWLSEMAAICPEFNNVSNEQLSLSFHNHGTIVCAAYSTDKYSPVIWPAEAHHVVAVVMR